MLIKLKQNQINKYIDYAYRLSVDLSKSCYPTFADGIKTKDDFIKVTQKAFEKENEEVFLFKHNNKVEGFIHLLYIPQDNYLSLISFCIDNFAEIAVKDLLDYASNFNGYDFYFGLSVKNAARSYLVKSGFQEIDKLQHYTLHFEQYRPKQESANLVKITKDNFEDFALLHQVDETTYWNTDRIFNNLSRWNIYLLQSNGKSVGATYFIDEGTMLEVFGINYCDGKFDETVMYNLMIKALNEGKRMNAKHLVYFAESKEMSVLDKLGLNHIDTYYCYHKKITNT